MRLSGRFVRVFQWFAPVVMPFLVIFVRGALGAPMGWMAALALFVSPIAVLLLLVLPIVVAFDRDAKAARSTRLGYTVASAVLWVGCVLLMLSLEDGGDSPPFGSVLTIWGAADAVAATVFALSLLLIVLGWLTALIYAIMGVVVSRTEGPIAIG